MPSYADPLFLPASAMNAFAADPLAGANGAAAVAVSPYREIERARLEFRRQRDDGDGANGTRGDARLAKQRRLHSHSHYRWRHSQPHANEEERNVRRW